MTDETKVPETMTVADNSTMNPRGGLLTGWTLLLYSMTVTKKSMNFASWVTSISSM